MNGQLAQNWAVLSVEAESGPLGFDRISQESAWALRIKTSASTTSPGTGETRDVTVRLPYRAGTAQAVRSLEQLAAKGPPSFIVGRLRASGSELELWPISAMTGRTFVNLADTPESESRRSSRDSSKPDVEALSVSHLERVKTELVRIADGGRRPSTTADLTRLANTAAGWGFPVIGDAIQHAPDHGAALLRACWVEQTLRDLDN